MLFTNFSSIWVKVKELPTLTPPNLFLVMVISGYFLFNLIPTFSNSLIILIFYSVHLFASRTIKIKSLALPT